MLDNETLNPEQRRAVETINGPVMILAGAGTGKTRVITYRIAHMINNGIDPASILAVTFTNKAAREMKERVAALTKRSGNGKTGRSRPTISTFHSLGVRILRRHAHLLGYKPNFVIYDQSDQVGVVRKIVSGLANKDKDVDLYKLHAEISRFKNQLNAEGLYTDKESIEVIRRLAERYDSSLRACNAVDFDDLLLLPLKLFAEHNGVLKECRNRYRFVLVDEYQDTNAVQFAFLRKLAGEHRNLCVVGDDDQSIYGWRGAEVSNLLEFEKYFPGVKIIKLEQNYRCTNTILNAANSLIKNNPLRRAKQLWSKLGTGEKICIRFFENEEAEAQAVAEAIECDRMFKRVPWSEQAVLYRTNNQARPLEAALRQAGIRYRIVGGQSFFDRREIKDVMAYLKTLANPHDDNSLLRIANVPARGLSDATMMRLISESHKHGTSIFGAMKSPAVVETFHASARRAIAGFVGLLERYREDLFQTSQSQLSAWARGFFTEIDYFEQIKRTEKKAETAEKRFENVRDFIDMIDQLEDGDNQDGPRRLQTFLEQVTLDRGLAEEKEDFGRAVTLITIHSCKGLEFPYVHIVGLEDGLLPHDRSNMDGNIQEERRLFYVAITRAKKRLSMSACTVRKRYGKSMPCTPSRFLNELPKSLVEFEDELDNAAVAPGDDGKNVFDMMRAAVEGDG